MAQVKKKRWKFNNAVTDSTGTTRVTRRGRNSGMGSFRERDPLF
jgi:hypothetical protein